MRRIKETFILCCAALIVFAVYPNPCCAQTTATTTVQGAAVKIGGTVNIQVPVYMRWKPDVPKLTAADAKRFIALKTQMLSPVEVKLTRPFTPGMKIPKLTKQDAMRAVELNYKNIGIVPYDAIMVEPGVDGRADAVVNCNVVGVNVSTDEGQCSITSSLNNFRYSFDVPVGIRTITYTKPDFYADPWQVTIQANMTTRPVNNITMTAATPGRGLRGYVLNVPTTIDILGVTLTLEGTCQTYVKSIYVSRQSHDTANHDFSFSFENIADDGVTYKIAITSPSCSTCTSCTDLHIPNSGSPPCILTWQ
jgi:hypothetical protein